MGRIDHAGIEWDEAPSTAEELAAIEGLEARLRELQEDQFSELEAAVRDEQRRACEDSFYTFFRMAWRQFDSAPFVPNWHIEEMARHLEAVARREVRDLNINIPPRASKSLIVSVAYPAWIWLKEPEEGTWYGKGTNFICASYAQSLAHMHSAICRSLITSPWYQSLWGHRVQLRHDEKAKSHYAAAGGGRRLSISVGSMVTGFGYDIAIVDDPQNAAEAQSEAILAQVREWDSFAFSTRANNPNTSCRILVAQRLHEKDLAGIRMEQGLFDASLVFPMEYEPDHPYPSFSPVGVDDPRGRAGDLLWPGRFDGDAVARLKRMLGAYGGAGQLQQRPEPPEGGILDPDRIEVVDAPPDSAARAIVRGWDLASTEEYASIDSSYTAAVKMARYEGDDHTYILDVIRLRLSPEKMKALFVATCRADGRSVLQDIPQDPGAAGKYVARDLLKAGRGFPVRYSPESGDKQMRALPFAAEIDSGRVRAVRGQWWQDFRDELRPFPLGAHEDQVDAASRAYGRLSILLDMSAAPTVPVGVPKDPSGGASGRGPGGTAPPAGRPPSSGEWADDEAGSGPDVLIGGNWDAE